MPKLNIYVKDERTPIPISTQTFSRKKMLWLSYDKLICCCQFQTNTSITVSVLSFPSYQLQRRIWWELRCVGHEIDQCHPNHSLGFVVQLLEETSAWWLSSWRHE